MSFKIPDELKPRVQSIIKECNEHLEAMLGDKVLVRLVISKNIDAELLQELVVDGFNTSWIEVCTTSRRAEVVAARQAFVYLNNLFLPHRSPSEVMTDIKRDRTNFYRSLTEAENRLFTKDHTLQFYPVLNSIISTLNNYQNETQTFQH